MIPPPRSLKDKILAAVDAEEELQGTPPPFAYDEARNNLGEYSRAIVRATKRSIRNRLDALLVSEGPQEENDQREPRHLIEHVGCGSVDDHGQCLRCDAIRAILRRSSPSEPWWLPAVSLKE